MTVSADARVLDVSDPRKHAIVRDEPDGRVALFTSIIAPGASPELTALVWHYARALELDPLRKQVMLISMDKKDDRGNWQKEYGVIVGVHGVIALIGRQKDYAGLLSGVVYPGEKCVIDATGKVTHEYDVIERSAKQGATAPTLPLGAYATVRRKMHGEIVNFTTWTPFIEVAQTTWKSEYVNGKPTGPKRKVLRFVWANRPSWMNEKCAIMFSSRKAYDHILGRVYGAEEFGALSTEDGIEVPDGFGDRVEVIEADAENPQAPSVQAGLIPGSETPVMEESQVPDGYSVDDPGDETPAEPTDSLFTDPEAAPAPVPVTAEEAERKLGKAIEHGAMTFTRKARLFVSADTDGSRYLVDAEALALMGKPKDEPFILTGATPDDIVHAARVINLICENRRNRHGR